MKYLRKYENIAFFLLKPDFGIKITTEQYKIETEINKYNL